MGILPSLNGGMNYIPPEVTSYYTSGYTRAYSIVEEEMADGSKRLSNMDATHWEEFNSLFSFCEKYGLDINSVFLFDGVFRVIAFENATLNPVNLKYNPGEGWVDEVDEFEHINTFTNIDDWLRYLKVKSYEKYQDDKEKATTKEREKYDEAKRRLFRRRSVV